MSLNVIFFTFAIYILKVYIFFVITEGFINILAKYGIILYSVSNILIDGYLIA